MLREFGGGGRGGGGGGRGGGDVLKVCWGGGGGWGERRKGGGSGAAPGETGNNQGDGGEKTVQESELNSDQLMVGKAGLPPLVGLHSSLNVELNDFILPTIVPQSAIRRGLFA